MMKVLDFETGNYGEILKLQEYFFNDLIGNKQRGEKGEEVILIGEHSPVITLGRRAKESNILVPNHILENRGVGVYHIGRGGDVTYHCPGQLIVYPIIDLEKHRLGVKSYVELLEESVIRLLKNYGIKGERVDGATGVWIGKGSDKERKVCAIGIRCRRYCTMHGIGLNVTSDLEGFSLINPCGFKDKGVTSMKKELEIKDLDMGKIKKEFLDIFLSLIFPF